MSSQVQRFEALHFESEPLLLGNVWNVQSARVLEKNGYKALGTSSYAVAETFGYADGENIPFDEYLLIIKRIINSTGLPLSVDLESGFGHTDEVVIKNISILYNLGVAGINIEDSIVKNSTRTLASADAFINKLEKISNTLASRNIDMFINLRCDAFLLNVPNKLEEALTRVKMYEPHVNGIFLPGITRENDIKSVIEKTKLPLNVLGLPDLPDFAVLHQLGVKRISIGNFLNSHIYNKMEQACREIVEDGNFSVLFS